MKEIKIHLVLRSLMKERNLTTTQLSKATGVPNSTLSTWLLPSAKPRDLRHLAAVAEFLQVNIEYLLFETLPHPSWDLLATERILDGYFRIRLERVEPPPQKSRHVKKKEI